MTRFETSDKTFKLFLSFASWDNFIGKLKNINIKCEKKLTNFDYS